MVSRYLAASDLASHANVTGPVGFRVESVVGLVISRQLTDSGTGVKVATTGVSVAEGCVETKAVIVADKPGSCWISGLLSSQS